MDVKTGRTGIHGFVERESGDPLQDKTYTSLTEGSCSVMAVVSSVGKVGKEGFEDWVSSVECRGGYDESEDWVSGVECRGGPEE